LRPACDSQSPARVVNQILHPSVVDDNNRRDLALPLPYPRSRSTNPAGTFGQK